MNATLRAALWMTGAIVSFSAMAIAGRATSLELDTFEVMLYRSLVGVVIVLSVATMAGTLTQVTRRNLGQHALRNLAHFTGQNLWFYAITVIPLAQVFALEFTSPLWVVALSPLLLGERLTPTRLLVAVLGFVGILIVARPSPATLSPGLIAAASSAVAFALTHMLTRRLTRSETITCILFYLTTMQAVFGLIAAGADGTITLPSGQTAPWLLLIGCAGLLAHFCVTRALSVAPATVVIPFDFTRLPLIALIGMLLYDEPLDLWVFVGAGVIFAANFINIRSETAHNV